MTIFILIIVAGVALYIYNSGVLQKGAQSIQSLVPHPATSTAPAAVSSTPASITPAPTAGGGVAAAPPSIPPVLSTAPIPTPTSSISSYDIPTGFTRDQLSRYFHQVRFGGMSPSYGFGSYGEITLSAYPQNPSSTLDVTGWQIKTARGGEYIPQTINIYDPSGLTPPGDIRMGQADYLYLYSSSAPFNLRLNKCIGYIAAQSTQFSPPLPQNCPYLDRSEIQNLSGECQNYVMSIGACAQPNRSSPYYPANDYACDQFVSSHFSYYSCFSEHAADSDFLSHEIWAWTGSDPLNRYHDTVELLDANGLLVDYYQY